MFLYGQLLQTVNNFKKNFPAKRYFWSNVVQMQDLCHTGISKSNSVWKGELQTILFNAGGLRNAGESPKCDWKISKVLVFRYISKVQVYLEIFPY